MTIFDTIIKYLHKDDQKSTFYRMLVSVIAEFFNKIDTLITKIYNNFYFSSLDIDGCEYWENLLEITPSLSQSLDDRRSTIRAKWLSNAHNSIVIIQQVCDSWSYGAAVADFINGCIDITFVGGYGIPDDFDTLLSAINKVKPAHLGINYHFKYLLIKDIHEIKTIDQMQAITINQFMSGRED